MATHSKINAVRITRDGKGSGGPVNYWGSVCFSCRVVSGNTAAISEAIFYAKATRPAPKTRAPIFENSSYPYRFALGQLGHLGQIAKTLTNRALNVSKLHIYTGTALGQAGTLRFQGVSGQAK
jgi:hypothetical protein